MSGRIIGLVILGLFLVWAGSAPGKIYIWTDNDNRTHYCNDPDDVPPEFKGKCRIIESHPPPAQPSSASSGVPSSPAPAPKALPPRVGFNDELEELMKEYRAKRREIQQYRRSRGDVRAPEYEELKRQLIEIKKRINEARRGMGRRQR